MVKLKKFTKSKAAPCAAAAVALSLLAGTMVGPAYAYFTTYVAAEGGFQLKFGTTTTITETFENWTKHVVITNEGENPCFVRVAIFGPEGYPLEIVGEGWSDGGDGYWYYNGVLEAGAQTSVLDVKITVAEDNADADFSVVVVHESTVVSNADGTAGDWSVLDSTASETLTKEA